MKMVVIRPVEKPKSFADVKFTEKDYDAAVKSGAKSVPYVTAMEALKNGRGLYEIEPEKKAEVEVKVEGLSVDQMDNQRLKMLALQMGVTIRKKQMKRSELVALVQGKMDAIEIVDDEAEVDETETEETTEE